MFKFRLKLEVSVGEHRRVFLLPNLSLSRSKLGSDCVLYKMLCLYRVSQEERSIFCEVIVSVILSKILDMYICSIPNGDLACA
jgi:hypothetical protein